MRLGALSLITLAFGCIDDRTSQDPSQQGGSVGTSGGARAQGGSSSGGAVSGGAPGSGGASMSGGGPNMSGGSTSGGADSAGGSNQGGSNQGGSNQGGSNQGGSNQGGSNQGGRIGSGGNAGNANRGGGSNSGGATGAGGTQGQGGATFTEPPRLSSGSNGWASRYWDCCKPACGWAGNVRSGQPMNSCDKSDNVLSDKGAKNACEGGGSAYMCWSEVPWAVSNTLAFGYAAASGGNYVCGRCFQIQFTGQGHNGSPASPQLNNKTMIVQITNNGGVQADQFDLLIPGGGVGQFNACSSQWGTSDLGAQYGGFLAGCNGNKGCVQQKCQTVFAGKPELQAGCDWFLNWFGAADNPSFIFKQIACPAAITQRSGLSDPG